MNGLLTKSINIIVKCKDRLYNNLSRSGSNSSSWDTIKNTQQYNIISILELLNDELLPSFTISNDNINIHCSIIINNVDRYRNSCIHLQRLMWDCLHIGDWKDVPGIYRDIYSYSTIILTLIDVYSLTIIKNKNNNNAPTTSKPTTQCDNQSTTTKLKEIVKSLDYALLVGGRLFHQDILDLIDLISQFCNHSPSSSSSSYQPDTNSSTSTTPSTSSSSSSSSSSTSNIYIFKLDKEMKEDKMLSRISLPSLQSFKKDYMELNKAVVITDAMTAWPARTTRRWSNLHYLKKVAGFRTVPVEVGRTYLDKGWSQRLITVDQFIDQHINNNNNNNNTNNQTGIDSTTPTTKTTTTVDSLNNIGYLAQTQLFDQIPILQNDIITPDYCTLSTNDEDNDIDPVFIVNAWFGPQYTTTPLHHDPYHNLLCQVVGRKYIRLYGEAESHKLYAHDPISGQESSMLKNTSQVDIESPDLSKYPLFKDATNYQEVILEEGEMLYIPPRCWHFVKSLSTSFSVSFWWS